MLEHALSLLLLLGCPAVVVGQAPHDAPGCVTSPTQVDQLPASAEKQQELEEELQRLIKSRDTLTKKIQRLQNLTSHQQQVLISVKMYELSLDKARNADINLEGVDSDCPLANGFGEALSAGVFDERSQAEDAKRSKSKADALHSRVVKNDEFLQKVLDELGKAGALKVLAEPTMVTVSGRPASFHVGGEFPIPVPQPNGDSTIDFRSFGTELHLVAFTLGQGRIMLQLQPRISEIDSDHSVVVGESTVPGLRVREVDTGVEMSTGHTFVVAGLLQKRNVHEAIERLDNADNDHQPGTAAKKPPEEDTRPNSMATEVVELIVTARVDILNTP